MTGLTPAKQRVAAAYSLAADGYDGPAMGFWQRFGNQLVDLSEPKPGDRVLDLCCGSGASALAAARKVGPTGRVLGIDISENLLTLARSKANRDALSWTDFELADAEHLAVPEQAFDVGQCAFGVFFFEDMTAPIRTLLRAVRPGGSIVVAIWGEGFWEPQNTVFDERIRRHRPDLYKGFQAWYRISTAADLAVLLTTAGATNVTVHTEHAVHLVSGVEGWWQVMWGSGYRGTLSQLTPTELAAVHEEHMQEIQPLVDGDGRLALAVPVHFGVAQVPDR
jgi:ubiquinone/menaquinone biosynthesis C-methylase UbiE